MLQQWPFKISNFIHLFNEDLSFLSKPLQILMKLSQMRYNALSHTLKILTFSYVD